MAEGHGDEFQRGRTLGETESTLAEHSAHLTRINGSMDRVAAELHDLVLGIQRLGDAADADRATAISLAAALEKAAKARQDNSDTRWSPMARFISVAVAVAVIAGVVIAYASLRR
jgi:hypothetical protein